MNGTVSVSIAEGTVVKCGDAISGTIRFTNNNNRPVSVVAAQAEILMVSEPWTYRPSQPWKVAPGKSEQFYFTVIIRRNIPPGPAQFLARVNSQTGHEWVKSVNLQIECEPLPV